MTRKRTSENELVASSGTAAAPVRRKTLASTRKKRAVTAPVAAATPTTPTSAAEPVVVLETATVETVFEPTREEIAALAYIYWADRGFQGGSPEEDWLRAEQELRAKIPAGSAATA